MKAAPDDKCACGEVVLPDSYFTYRYRHVKVDGVVTQVILPHGKDECFDLKRIRRGES